MNMKDNILKFYQTIRKFIKFLNVIIHLMVFIKDVLPFCQWISLFHLQMMKTKDYQFLLLIKKSFIFMLIKLLFLEWIKHKKMMKEIGMLTLNLI
jgi:hypothetical protein